MNPDTLADWLLSGAWKVGRTFQGREGIPARLRGIRFPRGHVNRDGYLALPESHGYIVRIRVTYPVKFL
jgi:hypothetical protein